MTLIVIWLAVLTILVFAQGRAINELNKEAETTHESLMKLVRAWHIHNMERRNP